MALPNPGMDAVPFTPLTAEFLDDMIENIESLSDGTGFENGAITTNTLAESAVTANKIDFTTSVWANQRVGVVNTSSTGGFGFTALNGGLTVVFPAINTKKYEVFISADYVAASSVTQFDLKANITGVVSPIDSITTAQNSGGGVPMIGRYLFTATSTGNITVTCGVSSGSATSIRTDNYMVSVRRIL